eukprot:240681-Hanusia_phi.AAC.3
MQQVHALVALPLLLARLARELDAHGGEERAHRLRVPHLDQAGVEVDLRRQGGYAQQAGGADG